MPGDVRGRWDGAPLAVPVSKASLHGAVQRLGTWVLGSAPRLWQTAVL